MHSTKSKSIRGFVSAGMIFLLAGFFRIAMDFVPVPSLIDSALFLGINLCFIGLLFIWSTHIRHRIVQHDVRRYLNLACALCIFWILLRMCKYRYFNGLDSMLRHLWYMYYIPQLFAPVLGLLAALKLGNPERSYGRWHILFVVSALLAMGVLSNDLHQLAFGFAPEFKNWNDNYTHGPIYWACMVWMIGCLLTSVAVIFHKCSVLESRKRAWIPLLLFFAGFSVCLMSFADFFECYQLPELFCMTFALTWESCMQIGLLPVNSNYERYLAASTISVQLIDDQGQVCYRAQSAPELTQQQMSAALSGNTPLHKNACLRAEKVRGGHVYWLEDLAHINHMYQELSEIHRQLEEENELVRAENELVQRRAKVREETRLYDRIAAIVRPQLDQIEQLLSAENVREHLRLACVLGAYVKRRSNLELLSETFPLLSAEELAHCIRESLEYLTVYGVACSFQCENKRWISSQVVILSYEFFQRVIEAALPALQFLLVNLTCNDAELTLRVSMESASKLPNCVEEQARLQPYNAVCRVTVQDDATFISLCVPMGGTES